jgi:1-acyl-sn-glycerol-3-phosphate acyltransferase
VPVGIRGAYEVWPRDSRRIRPHKVKIVFGAPMSPSETSSPDPYQENTQVLRDAVAKLIE